ncbi:vomeronasal 1 receptor ornAnaV1R3123 [Ornithorhynchus anatinus]|uniref:Vomeronasal type-1 receptor n=1 Tax=Ornithorhynchus anatinus TaxID=9258 RepID=F6VH07_ORNAN|nr:vomeronasal 1 receptor ornAnaV1R3123 [Ornithorhynchus anatinus]
MTLSDLILGTFFISQVSVGVLGNSALLLVYFNIFIYQPGKKKPTDLILSHLTMANMAILAICVVQVMVTFGVKDVLDDIGCKSALYINRVSRGLSICTTCLLSVFQAITISPSTSRWARLKPKATGYIIPSFLFFWLLNMALYTGLITSIQATKNVTITGHTFLSKGCSTISSVNYVIVTVSFTFVTFRDVFFVLIMMCASVYMVTVLYRHRKQVQHIHSTSLSPKSSVEIQAIKTILLLVSCFVFFYWINCCITLYLSFTKNDTQLQSTTAFLSVCYPSLCPWVLIRNDARVPGPQYILGKLRSSSPMASRDEEETSQPSCPPGVLSEDSSLWN